MSGNLYIDNTGVAELNGLQNGLTSDYINDATVECTLYLKGAPVDGQSWPLTLDYVVDSNGDYRGLLDAALDLSQDLVYTAKIVASSGGMTGTWNCNVVAKERPCGSDEC